VWCLRCCSSLVDWPRGRSSVRPPFAGWRTSAARTSRSGMGRWNFACAKDTSFLPRAPMTGSLMLREGRSVGTLPTGACASRTPAASGDVVKRAIIAALLVLAGSAVVSADDFYFSDCGAGFLSGTFDDGCAVTLATSDQAACDHGGVGVCGCFALARVAASATRGASARRRMDAQLLRGDDGRWGRDAAYRRGRCGGYHLPVRGRV